MDVEEEIEIDAALADDNGTGFDPRDVMSGAASVEELPEEEEEELTAEQLEQREIAASREKTRLDAMNAARSARLKEMRAQQEAEEAAVSSAARPAASAQHVRLSHSPPCAVHLTPRTVSSPPPHRPSLKSRLERSRARSTSRRRRTGGFVP